MVERQGYSYSNKTKYDLGKEALKSEYYSAGRGGSPGLYEKERDQMEYAKSISRKFRKED